MADQEHSSVNDLMGEFNLIHGNRIVRTFVKQFQVLEKKRSKGWDRIYIGIDIHAADERGSGDVPYPLVLFFT